MSTQQKKTILERDPTWLTMMITNPKADNQNERIPIIMVVSESSFCAAVEEDFSCHMAR